MRIRTSIIAAVAAAALAVPAVAASATAAHHYVQPVVVSTVYPGTSSISGGCTMTLVAGHVSSFRCPGSTNTVNQRSCTLTVAADRFWTYSCPGGVQGTSTGRAIPRGCIAVRATGYLWTFSCPKSAFNRIGTATQAATKQAGAGAITSHRCLPPLTNGYLMRHGCIL